MSKSGKQTGSDLIDAGWASLSQGAWSDAHAVFDLAVREEDSAEALEGLGWAAWWLNDVLVTFDARERAYRRYRDRGDQQGAGRMAAALAADHFLRRGEYAIANGWFQRAHRLLDDHDPCPEQAMLDIWESYVTVIFRHDTTSARRMSARARSLARSLGVIDLEMLAQASLGFAMVCEGNTDEGMRLLDEAAALAIAGEMTDPDAIVTTCCYLIGACERVRDYDRAAQWCARAIRLADRWSYRFMFAYCRSHYAGVLIWRGSWSEAEVELEAATGELAATFPAMAAEGIARLAELRRRQGRIEEAQALLDRLDHQPLQAMGGKLALLGRAAVALDRGDAAAAVLLSERFLRGVPIEDKVERVDGLELTARAWATLGDQAQAEEALSELRTITAAIATPALRGKACFVEGVMALAGGDLERSRRRFEDAIDLFEATGTPYEAIVCRLELARVLIRSGRPEMAMSEARTAQESSQRLGAARELERASTFLDELMDAGDCHRRSRRPGPLTSREVEVLRLVSQGLSDKEIGAALGLSQHTAHRHVANILRKLDVSSRAAAVGQAGQQYLI